MPDPQLFPRPEDGVCERPYEVLVECLDANKRNWAQCQEELKQFKACFNDASGKRSNKASAPSL